MGFTIEDMLLVSKERYQMELIGGKNGWSNSISWALMLEDTKIIQNFAGKELAVTTGLGFQTEEALLELLAQLNEHNAAGLVVNTGFYILEIPESAVAYCDQNDFPLLTVPWDVYLADMIKDISIRVFIQSSTDEQISAALIHAIETPDARDLYENELLPYFDLDGTFQVVLISTGDLDKMDTVDRKRLAYRMQLSLNNLTHNGHFFYYASDFVIIMNDVGPNEVSGILTNFYEKVQKRMPEKKVRIGISDIMTDISSLHTAYQRAKAAVTMAQQQETSLLYFEEMGIYRLLYSVNDRKLLKDLCEKPLAPLLAYDREHDADYTDTLEIYLKHNGSLQAMAAEMFIHRNTVMYRMNNIKKLLGCSLETPQERLPYFIACMIRHMQL